MLLRQVESVLPADNPCCSAVLSLPAQVPLNETGFLLPWWQRTAIRSCVVGAITLVAILIVRAEGQLLLVLVTAADAAGAASTVRSAVALALTPIWLPVPLPPAPCSPSFL